jgi:hypothetical protein
MPAFSALNGYRVESLTVMARILKRRVALLLIGLLVFAQGAVAFAACSMERGMIAHIAMAADEHCANCPSPAPQAQNGSLCVAHCTSDLQLAGLTVSLVRSPAQLPALVVNRPTALLPTGLDAPPSGAPPRRILLHSFLI